MYYFKYKTILGAIYIVEKNEKIINIEIGKEIKENHKNLTLKETKLINKTYRELDEYFKGKRQEFDIPLNLKGTDFQMTVWNELKNIPYGETRTYKDIAIAINNEKACRAVGGANNKNPIPIIIPCHRVIGANKKLVGYGCGLDIKEKLLEIENSKS